MLSKIVMILSLCCFVGCAGPKATISERDDKGVMVVIAELQMNRAGKVKTKTPNGLELEFDTRQPNFAQKYIIPAISSAKDQAEEVL